MTTFQEIAIDVCRELGYQASVDFVLQIKVFKGRFFMGRPCEDEITYAPPIFVKELNLILDVLPPAIARPFFDLAKDNLKGRGIHLAVVTPSNPEKYPDTIRSYITSLKGSLEWVEKKARRGAPSADQRMDDDRKRLVDRVERSVSQIKESMADLDKIGYPCDEKAEAIREIDVTSLQRGWPRLA